MFLGRPFGLLVLLDEQSSFPNATDKTLVAKLSHTFQKLPFFVPSKSSTSGTFTVQHYAGSVSGKARGRGGGGEGGGGR